MSEKVWQVGLLAESGPKCGKWAHVQLQRMGGIAPVLVEKPVVDLPQRLQHTLYEQSLRRIAALPPNDLVLLRQVVAVITRSVSKPDP